MATFLGTWVGTLLAGTEVTARGLAGPFCSDDADGICCSEGLVLAVRRQQGGHIWRVGLPQGVALVSYFVFSFFPISETFEPWAQLSPFDLYLGSDPLANSMAWGDAAILRHDLHPRPRGDIGPALPETGHSWLMISICPIRLPRALCSTSTMPSTSTPDSCRCGPATLHAGWGSGGVDRRRSGRSGWRRRRAQGIVRDGWVGLETCFQEQISITSPTMPTCT